MICDICGRLRLRTHSAMAWGTKTQFMRVKVEYSYDGREEKFDICPRCMRHMKRYLKRAAKKDRGEPYEAD